MLEKIENVLVSNTPVQFRVREILVDYLSRWPVTFNKNSRGRPAAERFDAKRAASGEQIEHSRADDGIAQA